MVSSEIKLRVAKIEEEVRALQNPAFRSMNDIVSEEYDRITERSLSKEEQFINTGFPSLDAVIGGIFPGDFVITAARPSMGKTSLCLNIAENVAKKYQEPVLVVSLEMSLSTLVHRLISRDSGIPANRLRQGKMTDMEWKKVSPSVDNLSRLNLHLSDRMNSISEIVSQVKLFALKQKPKLVVLDYLQLISGPRSENRVQEVSAISRELKNLAKEIECPVLAASQLSRAVDNRVEKKPNLSDIRDSGAIEQDADIILMIYREEYYSRKPSDAGSAEIAVAKNRNGPTGKVDMRFNAARMEFQSLHKEF